MANENLNYYTKREQKWNFYTHAFGVVLSVVGASYLIYINSINIQALNLFATIIYFLSLVNLFAMSSVYHHAKTDKALKITQKLDHLSISILIAGTATPVVALGEGGTPAIILIAVLWAMALFNIVCNVINVDKSRTITMISYIVMGALPLVFTKSLIANMGWLGYGLLLGGDAGYVIGLVFYAKKGEFMHAIWHLFVLLGAILHYFCILCLC